MFFSIKRNKICVALMTLATCMLIFTGCQSDDKPDEPPVAEEATRMTLVYAINKSSLAPDFLDDSREMLKAMENVGQDQKLLVYKTDNDSTTSLNEAVKTDGIWSWKVVKKYERTTTSTDPRRLREVIDDAGAHYPGIASTLFFWGHGSSWSPSFSDHIVHSRRADVPECYGFGGEYGGGQHNDYMEIDELANAVPDDRFDIIWFDCCYMSSMEVAYELKDKCKWIVAYPTEVWSSGLPYDLVLPIMMTKNPNPTEAARVFYNFYNDQNAPVTIAVMDMDKIESVAEETSKIYNTYSAMPDISNITNYGRYGYNYYDLVQMMKSKAEDNIEPEALKAALSEFVVFKASSQLNFNKKEWVQYPLSCVSIHNYQNSLTEAEEYYRSLKWYKRVMQLAFESEI